MDRLLRWLRVAGLVLCPSLAPALDPSRALDAYARQNWYTDDGLPHNSVHALTQDPDGYVWLATWDGVARFNGHEFRVYEREGHPEMGDDAARALAIGRDGTLYIGLAQAGLLAFDRHGFRRYDRASGLPSLRLSTLLPGHDGRLWIGTLDQGAGGAERRSDPALRGQ